MRHPVPLGFLVLTAAAWPVTAAAQNLTVVGVVRDTAGIPIALAEVTVMGRTVFSDSLGRFIVSHALTDSVRVSVRRMGYESSSFTLSADDVGKNSVAVVLRRFATALSAVNVNEMELRSKTSLRGFDERRQKGLGVFVGRKEIEARNTRLLTDVLRQARGVVVSRGLLKFTFHQAKNCLPMIFLDGQQAPGLSLDAVSPADVEGVELYHSMSTTPVEFHRGNQQMECGTIVLWTRRPILGGKP